MRDSGKVHSIPMLLLFIRADAASKAVPFRLSTFMFDPIMRFCAYLRLNELLMNVGCPKWARAIPLLLLRRLGIRLGLSVPLNVFGPGLAIVHYGLLVVSPHAKVGRNCRIHAGVNIGGAAGLVGHGARIPAAPKIGANCYLGPGAKIYGAIELADGCVVGANAVVNRSFLEPNSVLVGVPAKVVSNKGSAGLVVANPITDAWRER
jgi:serine O-acetyltransferase